MELIGKNFYYHEVEMAGKKVYVLLNARYPYIAFASDLQYMNIDFCDISVLSEEFKEFYRVLNVAELEGDLSKAELARLNSAELKQLNYYKPEKIKDIIFNFWD